MTGIESDMELDRLHAQGSEVWQRQRQGQRVAYLDIETATAPEILRELAAEVDHATPAAFVAWTRDHAADRALDPIGGRVICWAIRTSDDEERSAVDRRGGDEVALLEALLSALEELRPDRIVAHGGHRFDFPFLRARSLARGLPALAQWFWAEKPWDTRLVDTTDPTWFPRPQRETPSGWKYNLDSVAELLGLSRPDTIPGAEIPAAWYAQRFGEVLAHCLDDVRTLRTVTPQLAAGRRS